MTRSNAWRIDSVRTRSPPWDFSGAPMSPPVSTTPSPAQAAGGVAARVLVPLALVLGSIPLIEALAGVELHFETHPLASVELDGGSVEVTYEKGPLDRRCVRFNGAGADEEFCLAAGSEHYLGPDGEAFAALSPHPHRVQLDQDAVERVASKLIPSELSWWEYVIRPFRWFRGAAAVDTEEWERTQEGQWRNRHTGEVREHPPGGEQDSKRRVARLHRGWIVQNSMAMYRFSPLVDMETDDPKLRAVLGQLRQTTADIASGYEVLNARRSDSDAYGRFMQVFDEGLDPGEDPDYRDRLAAALQDLGFDSEWGPVPGGGEEAFLLTPNVRWAQKLEQVLTDAGYPAPRFVLHLDSYAVGSPFPEVAEETDFVLLVEQTLPVIANGNVGWIAEQYERHLMGVAAESGTPYFLRSTYHTPMDPSGSFDGDFALRLHQAAVVILARGLAESRDLAQSGLVESYEGEANPLEKAQQDMATTLHLAKTSAEQSSGEFASSVHTMTLFLMCCRRPT